MKLKEITITGVSTASIGVLTYLLMGEWWSILTTLSAIPIYLGVDALFKLLSEWLKNHIDIYCDRGIWLNGDYRNKTISVRFEMRNRTNIDFKTKKAQLSLFNGKSATDTKLINKGYWNKGIKGQTMDDLLAKRKGQNEPIICFTFPVSLIQLTEQYFRVTGYVEYETIIGVVLKEIDELVECDLNPSGIIVRTTEGFKKWQNITE